MSEGFAGCHFTVEGQEYAVDRGSDVYLGFAHHAGGLGAGASYSVTQEFGVPLFSLSQRIEGSQLGSYVFPIALSPNQQIELIVPYDDCQFTKVPAVLQGLVTLAVQEMGAGDLVMMQKTE